MFFIFCFVQINVFNFHIWQTNLNWFMVKVVLCVIYSSVITKIEFLVIGSRCTEFSVWRCDKAAAVEGDERSVKQIKHGQWICTVRSTWETNKCRNRRHKVWVYVLCQLFIYVNSQNNIAVFYFILYIFYFIFIVFYIIVIFMMLNYVIKI